MVGIRRSKATATAAAATIQAKLPQFVFMAKRSPKRGSPSPPRSPSARLSYSERP